MERKTIQSQALNHFTEKEAQSFSSSGTPQTIGLGYCLNPEWFNTKVAPIPSLDYYQALIKSIHIPSSRRWDKRPYAPCQSTRPAKHSFGAGTAQAFLQPPEEAEIARGHGHTESQAAGLGQSLGLSLCLGQWCALCSHGHAGNLLVAS